MTCHAKQHSCSMVCEPCGQTWDVNDSHPPACRPTSVEQLKQTPQAFPGLLESLQELERPRFEDACYAHFLARREAGKIDMADGGDGSREALFWRQENGEYGVLAFNSAWFGWLSALGLR